MPEINDTLSKYSDYYNRVQSGNRWLDLRFRASRALQSAELNEIQTLFLSRLKVFGDSVYKDGAIISDAVPKIIGVAEEPNLQIFDGVIYFAGAVNVVAGSTLEIPMEGKVSVGIRYREREISEVDDTSLRDPAVGSGNYLEAGAARRVADFHWGWVVDDDTHDIIYDYSLDENWTFFPIYEVIDGVIVPKDPPTVSDATLELIARYDREANGNYVVRGLMVEFVEELPTQYRFNIRDGVANVLGYKIDRYTSERMVWNKDPNTASVTDEPHQFVADPTNGGKYIMWLNRTPLAEISRLTVVKQKQVEVTRAAIPGGSDELPDAAVLSVLNVWQGETTYDAPDDYTVQGDNINWSPAGDEPSPGSTYNVEYTYRVEVVVYDDPPDERDECIVEITRDYLVLVGLVDNSQVEIDYTYKLPRVDLLVLNRDGTIERLIGIAQRRNPPCPVPASHQIGLAEIEYDWLNPPVVRNNAIRAIKMYELEEMREGINTLFDLVALERLKTEIALTDPSSKHGIFVDAFNDDDLRDNGIEQTAACVDGVLMLPIAPSIVSPGDATERAQYQMLPHTLSPVLEQPYRTDSMRINPYQAFDPIPAIAKLTPAVDRWVEVVSVWTSPATRSFSTWSSTGKLVEKVTRVSARLVWSATSQLAFIRVRSIQFELLGFGPLEQVSSVLFDGVDVTPA